MKELVDQSLDLLEEFKKAKNEDKWNIPFPMGVFGTLRKGCGNTVLMGKGKDNEEVFRCGDSIDYKYKSWAKAFLPHFYAAGLSIYNKQSDSAVFEAFFYDKDNWDQMIRRVDRLEGFHPSRDYLSSMGYHRTLVWLHLLPEDCQYESFTLYASRRRTLDIPEEEWDNYPKIPAWVYSNMRSNNQSLKKGDSPVIWYGK